MNPWYIELPVIVAAVPYVAWIINLFGYTWYKKKYEELRKEIFEEREEIYNRTTEKGFR